jgi:Rad3-related DNA helicase
MPGRVIKQRTGYEKNFKYENFRNGSVTRRDYLIALGKCLEMSKKPTLIHVNSFSDLPSEIEKYELGLDNLITKEELLNMQKNNNENINKFKNKEVDILFTTKCSRGIDFPGEQCNSIILTKYPYPDINSMFWLVLKKENPQNFMKFYMDKSRRELLQKIYRGVRSIEDEVILLSPDLRVLDANF